MYEGPGDRSYLMLEIFMVYTGPHYILQFRTRYVTFRRTYLSFLFMLFCVDTDHGIHGSVECSARFPAIASSWLCHSCFVFIAELPQL